MLPVVAGRDETKKQILIYSVLLLPTSAMLWILGFAGGVYGTIAVIAGVSMILFAVRLRGSTGGAETRAADRMFAFSIVYLFLLFALLLLDAAGHAAFSK
jgi:protoheme IX farnesyltransferase